MSEAQEIQMGEDEKWEEALKNLNDKAKERKWNRDTKINQRFYPNDKQVRYLNVMGCAPEDYIYGFDRRQGCSRLIDEYERKIRRFRKFHRNEDVASGLAVVIAEKLSSKRVRKRNELPKKNEIQRIYTTKTNGIMQYTFTTLHYGFGVPIKTCCRMNRNMSEKLLERLTDLHQKINPREWHPIRLEGIAMQIDPNHAEVIFDYNPFKDAMELLEIALKGKLILKKFHVHVHVYVVELALRHKQIPAEAKLLEAQPETLCQDRVGEGPANPGMEERMLRNKSPCRNGTSSCRKLCAWTFKGTKKSNRKRLKDTLTTIPPINDVDEGIALKNAQLRFKEENTKHLLELLYQMNHVRWKLRICKEKTNLNQKRQILPSSMKNHVRKTPALLMKIV
ncbi:hypothetical protein SELMODRAFT_419094 [Selaginella moellendorffii]|uniref:Uncharacterized protein n=1 Tax=Selaginella moellendorffii TaxID=88036 RepID=D8S7U0_SELML|nr:hypothetical protein SELMODRAFT_419094 [Selaginella moellendorffii]